MSAATPVVSSLSEDLYQCTRLESCPILRRALSTVTTRGRPRNKAGCLHLNFMSKSMLAKALTANLSNLGESWGPDPFPCPFSGPYPTFDFMFLTGQYPPGTVSHASNSYEQGRDYWEDVHYVRDGQASPQQQMEPLTGDSAAPQSVKDPNPLMAGYGQAGRPAPSHGGFRQPANRQAGGRNQVKV
ncbi:hypothetical protein EYF80_024473 [Liparis tanakae]|uniref:Uncharacterized protein n=1 Tax=Liparis tanakae TaxID=230148 RepID=A0A4Z2HHF1_9TELE|nr:hypothetical protein EYF80_024473 [Liparis tanakae]